MRDHTLNNVLNLVSASRTGADCLFFRTFVLWPCQGLLKVHNSVLFEECII